MTDMTSLACELKNEVEWQKTPSPLSLHDYTAFIKRAIKRLYVDTGRASAFRDYSFSTSGNREMFSGTLGVDEETYVMLLAQIDFFKKVQTDVNVMVSYTTDALSVAGGDKPYAHLKDSIDKLENERRIVYYKMVTYALGS